MPIFLITFYLYFTLFCVILVTYARILVTFSVTASGVFGLHNSRTQKRHRRRPMSYNSYPYPIGEDYF